jgi:hypothetical protein
MAYQAWSLSTTMSQKQQEQEIVAATRIVAETVER